MEDLYKYENELYAKGLEYIGGVDEVGRGPLIGSVVAACVVLPKDFVLEGLTDSKKLSEKKRDEYYKIIKENFGEGAFFTSIPQYATSFLLEQIKEECNKGMVLKPLEYPKEL